MLGPSSLIFSGHVRVICGSAQFKYEPDPLKLIGVRIEDAWFYSYAMDGPKLVGVTMSNTYDVV